MNNNLLQKNLSGWRIILAIAIGFGITTYMVYSSLQNTSFVEVEPGQGSYIWHDGNQNGIIDLTDESDFSPSKKGNYQLETVGSLIKSLSWGGQTFLFLGLAMVFMVGRDLFYIIRLRLLIKNKLSFKRSAIVILLWEFASALSPGVVGGAAVAMFILQKEKIALGKATAVVVITAFLDNLFYLIMIPFVFFFISQENLFPSNIGDAGSVQAVFWTGFAVIFIVCAILFSSLFIFPRLIKKIFAVLFSLPFLKKWKAEAKQTGDDVAIASIAFRKENYMFWLKAFAATVGSWMSRYLVINAILQAFISLTFIEHILLLGKQLVLWLFMLISPTPGASGVAEYAFGELLAGFTGSALLIVSLAVIWRLISYFPYLLIGFVLLPRWVRNKK
ncbi:MAG: hypothetical protein ACI9G9_000411 [Psychromonas sp.]|jgi:uncharacterized protein (TIRG00374 family)